MALILLVDDRSLNREYLATLLRNGGHSIAEARDGAEALETARSLRPDLIITDVLMPKIDGYVFVRQLRADADSQNVPVIFLTAHYEEDEIRKLAASCGVFHVITKPAEPEMILETVSRALKERNTVSFPQHLEQCDRDHLRLLTDKLAHKAEQLEIANSRLGALVELGQRLGTERDPRFLLSSFCHAAGEIHKARFTMVLIVDEETGNLKHIIVSAAEPGEAGRFNASASAERLMQHFFGRRQVVLINDMTRQPYCDHFPEELTALGMLIVAPIQTSTFCYGLLCMAGFGSNAADDSLVKLAGSMGAVLAVAYENALRYEQVDHHAEQLRVEVTERTLAQEQVQKLNEELEERVRQRTAELEASHQQLRQSERMATMGTFSAGLAHDISNMLYPMQLNLDGLKPNVSESDFKQRTESIRHCLDYLGSLTRGLRLLTLNPDGRGDDDVTNLDDWESSVKPLLRCMISPLAQLHWECPPNLPPIAIASHRLTQALFNLVKNASDALGDRTDGEIRVKVSHDHKEKMVRFTVSDNGVGMEEEVRKKALEPFFTTKARDSVSNTKLPSKAQHDGHQRSKLSGMAGGGGGTGLGLSMVYGIARGNLSIESEPGAGTTVSINFPLTRRARPTDDGRTPITVETNIQAEIKGQKSEISNPM